MREPDQRPVRLALAHAGGVDRLVDLRAHRFIEARVPPEHRVVVVRARVDDGVRRVVARRVHVGRVVRPEPELQHDHAGIAEPAPQPLDRLRDHSQVLRDHREIAQRRGRGVERRPPRPALPPPGQRVPRPLRHRPVRAEAAEVVDPHHVEQLERAPQPLGPPPVAAPPQRRPVVQRVAPQLALRRVGVRRRARDRVVAEQLRVRAVVDRSRRDVDRHVADQAHPALGGMRPQRRPLAIEPHLVGDRAARAEPRPVVDPIRVPLTEVDLSRARHARPRRGQQPRPRRERGPRLVRRAVPVGRPQRQHLPPRLAGVGEPVDERVRVATEPPGRQRGGVQLDAAGTGKVRQDAITDKLPLGMPAPQGPELPPRIQINYPAPTVDGGRYPVKRCVGDTVGVSADVFRDGHEKLRAVVRYKAPGAQSWLEAPLHPIDAHINGVRWQGEFTVETPGRWEWTIEAWSDQFATWRDELQRKLAAGQTDLGGELSEGVVLLEDAAQASRRGRSGHHRARARGARRRSTSGDRARPGPQRGRRAQRRAPWRGAPAGRPRRRGRPRARAVLLVVRAVPALVGRVQGCRGADPGDRRARVRRPVLHAHPPDRPQEPQGAQQHAGRRSRRPRLAVRDRRRRGRPRRGASRAGHDGRPAIADRHRPRARDGRGARHRAQRVGRPPVADRAPGVVPAAPRRHDQVRREPAQEVPGHLQLQLGHAGVAGAVGGVAADLAGVGRRRREGVPRRQPAHQAVPVLGVADRRGPQGRPRRDLPGGGVHAPRRDAGAGEARLHAVLHVLHVEELALGADRVRRRAGLGPGAGVLPAELLPGHAGHPARLPAARRAAGVPLAARPRGDAEPQLRHLLGLRELRERAGPRGLRGVPELREVRDPRARARRPAAADDPAHERDPAREPGAAGAVERLLAGVPERRADRLREAGAGQHPPDRDQHRSASRPGGRDRDPRAARPAARLRGRGPAHRRRTTTGGSAPTTSGSSRAARTSSAS